MSTGEHLRAETGGLASGFVRAAQSFPRRPALEVAGETLTYGDLAQRAASIAALLRAEAPPDGRLAAVFAYRSVTAFSGILASLLAGFGYVPLNRRFPPERTRIMLERSRAWAVVVDEASAEQLDEVLGGSTDSLLLVFPDVADVAELERRFPRHRVVGAEVLDNVVDPSPVDVRPDDVAYLLFTSGSTGIPKGVRVAHRNVEHYLAFARERWGIDEQDRVSQTFDMTFDLSVHDMFTAWDGGACVCCPPAHVVTRPAKYIRESGLTVWYSVPSVGIVMKRLGMLKPDAYPELRFALFCGEPLPAELAAAWAAAAPNAVIENLYGPTEATISCSAYTWDGERSPGESEHGIVPIGAMNPGMSALVANESLRAVEAGDVGELLVSGPQVTLGYLDDPQKTATAFVEVEGARYYRTGDLVRSVGAGAPLTYLGRVDHQVKISGHRVELGEIEAVLREASGVEQVVAVGWPRTDTGYSAVAAFVGGTGLDLDALKRAAAGRLPDYMTPRVILEVEDMPLNANGKIDRNALVQRLEAEQ